MAILAQADRDGRADEFGDAYAESELWAENARLMTARPGMESRTSITTIQELAVTQGTVTPFWWGLWVLVKVSPCPSRVTHLSWDFMNWKHSKDNSF